MNNILKAEFHTNSRLDQYDINADLNEVHIDKSTIGNDENERLAHNFLAVGRRYPVAKQIIAKLSCKAFYLTHHSQGVSVFKKLDNSKSFVEEFNDKDVKVWNDTFYTLEEPLGNKSNPRLVVVFSSIADFPFNASISRRMFFKNYNSIKKYIPKNTYILRIADIGGVLGSFYLNSKADPNFERKVQSLILKVQREKNIPDRQVVLYGGSKGATGALYHGMKMGLKTVSVDPIVSDDFYINKHNDLHFVEGVFPRSKQENFNELMAEYANDNLSFVKLVTSKNSEQYTYIEDIILTKNNTINSYIFNNPQIKSHPDVGKHTLNFVTSMLNNLLYDLDINMNIISEY